MGSIQGKKILVIDDDDKLLQLIEFAFSQAGCQVYTALNGPVGLRQFYEHRPDLVILDLMMPDMDGFEVCRNIRQNSEVPLIMLTALAKKTQMVQGLNHGADDYVTKPFSVQVLLTRARAILRRAALPPTRSAPVTYSDDYLTINLDEHRVLVHGKPVRLSVTEYRLLAYLFQHAGRVLTYRQILGHVWGETHHGDIEYVHTYISHLRQKLEKDAKNPDYLLTEYKVGYRFEKHLPRHN